MKDLLRHYKKPSSKQEMVETIQAVCDEISLEQLQTLIATMPSQIQAMISMKGASTKW